MEEEKTPKFRGLYRYVHISVKALDRIIIACIVVIILATLIGLRDPGYLVTFDSKGGTDIAALKCDYDEPIPAPEPPTREGYTFTGWFRDPGCTEQWNLETDHVTGDLTLYACWEKNA